MCAHPGCALIFPTQQRLDEHCKTHGIKSCDGDEVEPLMAHLKSETVIVSSSSTGMVPHDAGTRTSWPIFQEVTTSTTSALDLIINPRALHIRHQDGDGDQKCHHCDLVFNSVEQLALHVKQHIFKADVGKRKKCSKLRKCMTHESDTINLDQPRKSGRSRNSRFVQDPDFVYGLTPKQKCEMDSVETQKVKHDAASPAGRNIKHLNSGEQVVKRKRGRPPKRQRPNRTVTNGGKNVDIIEIIGDKSGTGETTSGQLSVCNEIVDDKTRTVCEKEDVGSECFTQSTSMVWDEGVQSRVAVQNDLITNEGIALNDSAATREGVVQNEVVVKKEVITTSLDIVNQKSFKDGQDDNLDEFWHMGSNPEMQQDNIAQSRSILVIGEQDLNANSCDIACAAMVADVHGQYSSETDASSLTEDQSYVTVIKYRDMQAGGQEAVAHNGPLSAPPGPEVDRENFTAVVDKMNSELHENNKEVKSVGDWNPDSLSCADPMEVDDHDHENEQEEGHIISDHGNYSVKTIDAVCMLKVSPDVTSADNPFTTTTLVPSIVNLDDMDVITGESLSGETKQGQLDGDDKLNEGKAIINENKTHYLCTTCQTERPLVSIKELEDHLYTHIGVSKCPKCDELFVEVADHECKANAKCAGENQPAKDSEVREESNALNCYDMKGDRFVCGICKRLFDKEAHLVIHLKRHSSSTSCKQCNRTFTSDDQLQKHDCQDSAQLSGSISEPNEQKAHFCEFCGASYKKRQYLLLHMATHTREHKCEKCGVHFARKETLMKHWTKCMPEDVAKKDVFSCAQCSRVFTKELSLQNHVLAVHTNSFKCDRCLKAFSSMFSMERHACMQYSPGKFECTICPKVFRRRLYLKRHMAMHSGKFTCILCQQHYARKEELLNHMLECSASIQFETTGTIKCTVCDKVYSDVHAYRIHYQDHTHPYKCEICNKPFLRPMALEAHKRKCKPYDGDPVICSICNKKFRSQIYLLRHKQVHDEKKYTCKQCNRKFRRIDYLNNHVCVDNEGRQILSMQHYKKEELVTKDVCICPHCGKTFQTTSNLNKHILLHGEKKEVCEVCGKKFHLKVGLREHMKYVHTDQYLIECKVCKKRLKSRNSLYGHMAVYHSDIDTVYPCEECGKTFRQKGNLKKHMLVHSENRLFNCKQCDKKFKFPEQLRRHELWHATGPRFFCDLCDKAFVMEFEIKKHLNTIHGGKIHLIIISVKRVAGFTLFLADPPYSRFCF